MQSTESTDGDAMEELAERGPIATLFSGPARTRVIEAFVANKSRELNVSDIARESDSARSSVYRHIEDLEELGIIKIVNTDGNQRFTIDEDSEIARLLCELEGVTLKRLLEIEDSAS